ncbi:Fucose isomerase [Entamoeba marina]
MEINLITLSSDVNVQGSIEDTHKTFLDGLKKHFTIKLIQPDQLSSISKDQFSVVFITSGGVEQKFIQHYDLLPKPTLLLNDGLENSLAASLEIATWLKQQKTPFEILHGEIDEVVSTLKKYISKFQAKQVLSGKRIGVIGKPSDWLIASNVEYKKAMERWGVIFTDICLDDVIEEYNKINDSSVQEEVNSFMKNAKSIREGNNEEVIKAMRLYKALFNICKTNSLDAMTLRCFGLIDILHTTGCLALALLNQQGIHAGCEGDMQSIFTMMIVQALTKQTGFMANPSIINKVKNEVMLAHCTIAPNLCENYVIRSHFETQTGIAIQGIMPLGDVTVVKCGGKYLDEYFVSSGILLENHDYVNACRTQIRIHLKESVKYFLTNPVGNHHIVILGNYADQLKTFFEGNECIDATKQIPMI